MNTFVYDVESQYLAEETLGGWDNPRGHLLGTAVAYNYGEDRYEFYGPKAEELLVESFTGCRVVSFNGIRYDNCLLLGNDYRLDECPWENIDLLKIIICARFSVNTIEEAVVKYGGAKVFDGRTGLNQVVKNTLGAGKMGQGSNAPQLIRQARWMEVTQYNLHDTRLTRQLFEYMLVHKKVCIRGGETLFVEMPDFLEDSLGLKLLRNKRSTA